MIGSHNSFTFLQADKWYFNLFSFLWRCQTIDIYDQYKEGVRFFDIRVFWDSKSHLWRPCHGKCNFNGYSWESLDEIITFTGSRFKDTKYRIVLEKGNNDDITRFIEEYNKITDKENLAEVAIKSPWKTIKENNLIYIDFTYCPWNTGKSFWWNIRHFKLDTIKHYAKKHNPFITKEMKDDQVTIYFMDYVK